MLSAARASRITTSASTSGIDLRPPGAEEASPLEQGHAAQRMVLDAVASPEVDVDDGRHGCRARGRVESRGPADKFVHLAVKSGAPFVEIWPHLFGLGFVARTAPHSRHTVAMDEETGLREPLLADRRIRAAR